MGVGTYEPLVSCIIPTYNRANLVSQSIDSALNQSYRNLEIIVVDDGSTDDTRSVLSTYGDKIKVIYQNNLGTGSARNAAIRASKGEFLAWLDSDDLWLPHKVAWQVQVAADYPEAPLIYSYCIDLDQTSAPPAEPDIFPTPLTRSDILAMVVVESEIMPQSCLVRREAGEAVGWFDTDYGCEDWEFHLRLALRYLSFVCIPVPLTAVRIHQARKTAQKWTHANDLLCLRHKIESFREEILTKFPGPEMTEAYRKHTIKYAEAFHRVGKFQLSKGEVHDSLPLLKRALELNPWVAKYYTRYMLALLKDAAARQRKLA